MRFSLIFEAQMNDASPANEQRVIRECVDEAALTPGSAVTAMLPLRDARRLNAV